MIRALVTGASGFIGRHCLAALAARDDVELHAVSRTARASDARVVWHAADLLDAAAIDALLAQVRPTHLLHAAWEATPVSYASSPENLRWLARGVALADAFGRSGGRRFLGLGSSAEYGPSDAPCAEERTPITPATVYGHAKAAMAEAARAAARAHGFSSVWARLFLPFGPGDPPGRLIPSLVRAFREGRRLPMSDGLQERDFIHAADAGRMIAALLVAEAEGAFNIGTGEAVSIRTAAEAVARLCGGDAVAVFGELPRRPGEPQRLVADMTRTFAVPGMPPPGRFEQRLAETLPDMLV